MLKVKNIIKEISADPLSPGLTNELDALARFRNDYAHDSPLFHHKTEKSADISVIKTSEVTSKESKDKSLENNGYQRRN